MEGLEPPRREAPDPKSGAATNYATCAVLFSNKILKETKERKQGRKNSNLSAPAVGFSCFTFLNFAATVEITHNFTTCSQSILH